MATKTTKRVVTPLSKRDLDKLSGGSPTRLADLLDPGMFLSPLTGKPTIAQYEAAKKAADKKKGK